MFEATLRRSRSRFETAFRRRRESSHEVTVVDTVRDLGRAEWNDVVDRSSCASVFHRFEWIDAIESGLPYAPRHLVVRKDGNTIGLFPNFVRKLPNTPFRQLSSVYPGYGGPLLPTDRKESLELVIDGIPDLCAGRTIVHELRTLDTDYLGYNRFLQSRGYEPYRGMCRHQIDLTDGYDEIFDAMSRSRRKAIRRGRENDHEIVEEAVTEANLRRFHGVYERVMERVGGKVHPVSFFEHLAEMQSNVLLLTIRIDGEYAGGFLELLDDDQSTVRGFFSAVPEEYYDHHAKELLYDYVVRWGIENGYETYDFDNSPTDFESGVFRYKDGFGGEVVPTFVWERGDSPLWNLVKYGRRKYVSYRTRNGK